MENGQQQPLTLVVIAREKWSYENDARLTGGFIEGDEEENE